MFPIDGTYLKRLCARLCSTRSLPCLTRSFLLGAPLQPTLVLPTPLLLHVLEVIPFPLV